jgi:hypothetical protein
MKEKCPRMGVSPLKIPKHLAHFHQIWYECYANAGSDTVVTPGVVTSVTYFRRKVHPVAYHEGTDGGKGGDTPVL